LIVDIDPDCFALVEANFRPRKMVAVLPRFAARIRSDLGLSRCGNETYLRRVGSVLLWTRLGRRRPDRLLDSCRPEDRCATKNAHRPAACESRFVCDHHTHHHTNEYKRGDRIDV
jgi:hypothetical protein